MCPIITLGGRGKHCFYLMKDLFLQKQCSIQVINTPSRTRRVHSKHMEIKSNDAQKTMLRFTYHADSFLSSFSHLLHSDSLCSHTYSTLFSHLLHFDSYLSHLWLIAPTLTPPLPCLLHYDSFTPICTFTIYTARYPPVTLAWSYSNIPEF